ncbi:MAG: hypothetical protein LBC39_07760 [Methanobrevibacter sp.]|nr:hypothetical protein [Candidatus Methanovirga aequatorialis]
MVLVLTNVSDLNKSMVNKSLKMLDQDNLDELNEISEIFYLKEKSIEFNTDFDNVSIDTIMISMDNVMDEVYNKVTMFIGDLIKRKDFINVVVDTSFLGYVILEVLIKKFDIVDVFLVENGELKKAHPCSCGSDYIGY